MNPSVFTVTFSCKDNIVRFFVSSKKDIGSLSNSIEGFLLRPCAAEDAEVPESARTEHFVNFVEGGNLLDLKERYHIKKVRAGLGQAVESRRPYDKSR